jgi:hypothetical protein
VEGTEYTQIHADIADDDLNRLLDPARRDALRVIFMTSSASRGLSFPRVTRLLIEVPRFSIESNLMEIIQTLYRGRGGAADLGEKEVTFYITDALFAPEGPRAFAAAREAALSVLTLLCLLKLCLLTRLRGAAQLRDRAIALIPIGGKTVGAAARAFHHSLADCRAALARARRGPLTQNPALERLAEVVEALLATSTLELEPRAASYLTLYEQATPDRLDAWLVSDEPSEPAYTLGSLLLVPLAGRALETAHHLLLQRAIALARDPRTEQALRWVYARRRALPPTLLEGVRELEALLDALRPVERSQRLEHSGRPSSAYVVLPIAAFVAKDAIAAYCQAVAADPARIVEREQLRAVLLAYVRDAYPVETVLPLVGSGYSRLPFLVITSQDLAALRAKRFRLGHVLMSHELNLLTLLLAEDPPTAESIQRGSGSSG